MSLLERPNPVNWWYILYLNSLRLSQNLFRQFTPYTYLKTKILLKDIQNSWKIWLGLDRSIKRGKCISWKENVARVAIITSFFFSKSLMMDILFAFSGMGAKMKSSVAMLKPVKMMINVRNAMGVAMKVKSGYVVLHVINGTMKTAFYE